MALEQLLGVRGAPSRPPMAQGLMPDSYRMEPVLDYTQPQDPRLGLYRILMGVQ